MKSSKSKWAVVNASYESINDILQAAAAVATVAPGALKLLSVLHLELR